MESRTRVVQSSNGRPVSDGPYNKYPARPDYCGLGMAARLAKSIIVVMYQTKETV
jgi:hypothetical protein